MLRKRPACLRASTQRWSIILLSIGLVSGCALNPAQEEARILAPVPQADLNRARALEAQGKATAAAEVYLKSSSGARPPAREQLQIRAVQAYLAAGNIPEAQKTINAISRKDLTATQRDSLLLAEAQLALLRGSPRDAIIALERLRDSALPRDLKLQRLGMLAAAQRLADEPIAAARTLNEIDPLLDQSDDRLLNQVSLISTLNLAPVSDLEELVGHGAGAMKGWAEIALLTRDVGADPATFESRYRQWHTKQGGHPARADLAQAYAKTLSGGYTGGDQVTIMLPRGGRFAGAARAVQDGIEAASRADTTGHRPTLDYRDSTQVERVQALYTKAVQEQTDYVLGPLEKPAVDALAAGPALAIPTLALNEGTHSDKPAGNLYQFALSPENEAAEVANKAASMGHRRALVLYPEGAWGERLASAFRQQWTSQGGTLTGQTRFSPTQSSYDKTLAKPLTGGDIDLVFLVATPELARKIHPRIRALSPRPVTVMATSHVYSGRFQPSQDAALVGLYFVDIPWMLGVGGDGPVSRRRLTGDASTTANPLARLYAMGIDAYRLAPHLRELARNPGTYYPGQTGGLSIDATGRIRRQLVLARFTETGPRIAEGKEGTPALAAPTNPPR